MNQTILAHGIKFDAMEEYAIEYLDQTLNQYISLTEIDPQTKISGRGHRKTTEQLLYGKLYEYIEKLKNTASTSKYAVKTETAICEKTI